MTTKNCGIRKYKTTITRCQKITANLYCNFYKFKAYSILFLVLLFLAKFYYGFKSNIRRAKLKSRAGIKWSQLEKNPNDTPTIFKLSL